MTSNPMKISAILAVSENNVIGADNQLPWRLSNDLKWFKKNTLHKPMIMGRKTFQSLPGMLKDRTHIMLTRDTAFTAENVLIAQDIETAIELATSDAQKCGNDEIMIIGGGEIYRLFKSRIDCFYVTRVHTKLEGDTYFYDLPSTEWALTFEEDHGVSERNDHPHSFQILKRKSEL